MSQYDDDTDRLVSEFCDLCGELNSECTCDEGDTCPECDGNGWVDDPSDGGTMTCPECDGEGHI